MEYEVIELIKQSKRGVVQLIQEKNRGQYFIRKEMNGRHSVYLTLQDCPHPCLPKLYEVNVTDDATVIIEEYIEGRSLDGIKLSKRQFLDVVKDLCTVLEFLHGMGIIHRDIKPSNIIYAGDGHIRLIDFDAARMPKDDQEQDTRLLGTRGYAPPEQYGFSQTDVRTDIYSLGITLEQILWNKIQKLRYKRIIKKCTDLNPDKRYQSVQQVRRAFFYTGRSVVCGLAVLVLVVLLCGYIQKNSITEPEPDISEKYPNQILWRDLPVRSYLGRYIDEIMDEMDVPYDEYTDGEDENICSYREVGIVFIFDNKRKVYLVALDPAQSTFNGELLDVNQEKLIEILGDPVFAGWTEKQLEDTDEVYFMDYYDIDTKAGATFYMPSPEEEANIIYID